MKFLQIIFFTILFIISKLPLKLLYIISDFFTIINYYIIGYRRKTIIQNLKNSFPEKTPIELKKVEKNFYRNFSDYLVETLKAISISRKKLQSRISYTNIEVFEQIKSQQKNVVMMLGHVFNWEWFAGSVQDVSYNYNYAVYKPIKNKFWNEKVNYIRERFGAISISANDVVMKMMRTENDAKHNFFFVADQSPKAQKIYYYTEFLNQKTPVFIGFDKVIRKKNLAVVYCEMIKLKRGYYHINFKEISPKNNNQFEEYEIVHSFFYELEKTIHNNPDNWLWSHKRWKK